MISLVSGQFVGVSSKFPTSCLVRRSRRNGTGSPSHLDDDTRRPNQSVRERMLGDSNWFMCALEVQTTNSGTMGTLNWYMDRNRECAHCDEGRQRQGRLDPHTTEAQSVSVFEGQAIHSRSKGQEQLPLSIGSYHSYRTTFPPSFSVPSSFTSLFLISTPLLFLSEPDGLLTTCLLAHWSACFRRALLVAFTTIASSRALLFNEYCQWPFPRTTHRRSLIDHCVGL